MTNANRTTFIGPSAKVAGIQAAAKGWAEDRERERTKRAQERAELLAGIPAGQVVWVRRQWDGKLSAAYRFTDLHELHLSDVSGGVDKRANRDYVHGYVNCDAMIDGELDHSCRHGPAPHSIKVYVVGVDNGGPRSAFMRRLRRLAELH